VHTDLHLPSANQAAAGGVAAVHHGVCHTHALNHSCMQWPVWLTSCTLCPGASCLLLQINKTMQQFAQENARMEMAQEMMGDTLDSALDDEATEEDAGELVSQVGRVSGTPLETRGSS